MSGAAARLFADPSHPGTEAKTTIAAAAQTPREWIQAIPTRGDVLQNSTDPRVPGRSAVIPAALWDR